MQSPQENETEEKLAVLIEEYENLKLDNEQMGKDLEWMQGEINVLTEEKETLKNTLEEQESDANQAIEQRDKKLKDQKKQLKQAAATIQVQKQQLEQIYSS